MRMRFALLGVIAALSTATYDPSAADTLPNGVSSGDVTAESAVLWARATVPGTVAFNYSTDPNFAEAVLTVYAQVGDPLVPARAGVDGLLAGSQYFFQAVDAAGVVQSGRFRTLHDGSAAPEFSFGVSGDWRGELSPYPAIGNADTGQLDLFVKLGDTIYADYPSPDVPLPQCVSLEDYRRKHQEVYAERYERNTWRDLQAVTPIWSTIDDHEVINDFAGGAPPSSDPRFDQSGQYINETDLYRRGLQAFQEYNAIREEVWGETGDSRTAGKIKLYRAARQGRTAALLSLDARSFRDRELVGANPLDPQDVGRFLVESFSPTRTMLGRAQMDQVKADLLSAQADGVVWKFILVPEPIQNLGVVGAADRFEGYAAERTEILSFVAANQISNVVFVAADIHGTLVNNLTYQLGPFQPQIQTAAWEISTGSVAFDAPFGPTVVEIAAGLGFLTPQQVAFYESLPREGKDAFVRTMVDQQIQPLGYDAVGLEGSGVPAELLEGSYANLHTFGWSQFEIDPNSFALTVTTYGIDPYTREELESDPDAIVNRELFVVGRFRVQAALEGGHPTEVDSALPAFSLRVTPMPTLDRASLRYSVPSGVGIDLSVIDISGRTIRRLAVGDPQAGEVTWDLADEAGRRVPAGVYFAQLRAGDRIVNERVVIAR